MPKKHFQTNVLLKSIIGKDLINSDGIAVLELAKNSFDAGSKRVEISFKNILKSDDTKSSGYSSSSSKITIQDWGCGMDEEQITSRWLNIAYSEKKKNSSQHGRRMAGAKGIGRFSCDRLGRFLDIYTRKKDGRYNHIKIDWQDFETENSPDKLIQSVAVDVSEITETQLRKAGHAPFAAGTIVEISRLRSTWDEHKLRSLRQYLERLLNPNQQFSKTTFSLWLHASEFPKSVNGEIRSRVFDRLDFTSTSIESTISPDGQNIKTVLSDKGRQIFELVERNSAFPLLRDVKVVIYYLNQYGKAYFKRATSQDKVSYGSIFLFINGFRIPPYGDEKDDWLGLDRWKSQSYGKYLGTREVVGRIEINDEAGDYKIISSREGIAKDDRFDQLTEREGFYFSAQRRLESYVIHGLDWDRAPKEEVSAIIKKIEKSKQYFKPQDEIYTASSRHKNLQVLGSLGSTLSVRPKNLVSLDINTELLEELRSQEQEQIKSVLSQLSGYGKKIGKSTTRALEKIKIVLEHQERKLQNSIAENTELAQTVASLKVESAQVHSENLFLRSAVSTDSKEIMALQHQIGLSSKRIEFKLKELAAALANKASPEVISPIIKIISLENKKIQSVSRFVTKANFSMETRWIEKDIVQFISEYIERVYQEYAEFKINNTGIAVKVATNGCRWVRKFTPLEMIIVVDNLLDNARKANARTMSVEFILGRTLQIIFKDNGDGIPAANLPKIFDFGFTTTEGSGLGLYHVKDILEKMGGSISAASKPNEGCTLILQLPK